MSQKDNWLWQSSGKVQNLAENTPVQGGLEGVQYTHPLEEKTKRSRLCTEKVQLILKQPQKDIINHYKSRLPTLGAFWVTEMAHIAFQTLIALGKKLLFS